MVGDGGGAELAFQAPEAQESVGGWKQSERSSTWLEQRPRARVTGDKGGKAGRGQDVLELSNQVKETTHTFPPPDPQGPSFSLNTPVPCQCPGLRDPSVLGLGYKLEVTRFLLQKG